MKNTVPNRDGTRFPLAASGGMGVVALYPTAIPVARDGRDKGRKAVSGE